MADAKKFNHVTFYTTLPGENTAQNHAITASALRNGLFA